MSTGVVLVGAGKVGKKEARVLQVHPEYELLCICEVDQTRRETIGSATGVPTYYLLERALAATDGVDLVYVSTPPSTHFSLAIEALDAGADVYVEKIMTLDASEAEAIVETARDRGRRVYVRRNSLYTPMFDRLFAATDSIGEVRRVSFFNSVSSYDKYSESKAGWLRTLPGGVISEHLPHSLYVVRHLLGAEPTAVDATYDGETLLADLHAPDAVGSITYLPPGRVAKTVTVIGTEGALLLNEDARQLRRLETFALDNAKARIAADNVSEVTSAVRQAVSTGLGHLSKHVLTALGSERGRLRRNTHYRQLSDIAETPEHDISGDEGYKNVVAFESVWEQAGEL